MIVALLVLALLVAQVATVQTAGWLRLGALLATTLVWLPTNQVIEGPVLLSLTPEHGFTTADVLGVLAVGAALLRARALAAPRRATAAS